jgi:ubiquinone/menaquinone biosynthesis C-methylase UbiE
VKKITSHSTEPPSTYVVQDRTQEEIHRLEIQDKMMTIEMGGVLSELDDPTRLRHVLDVGCGTGGWLMETARVYPTIEKLVGVDVSVKVVTHARAQAKSLGLGERVQFQAMDALLALDFPAASFDLINQRAGLSWVRTWDWTKILMEYQRVSRPGGIIRITEPSLIMESKSPALMKLNTVMLEAFYHSGHFFAANSDGVARELAGLMVRHGIKDVQSRVHTQVYSPSTETGQYFYEDMLHVFRLSLPFFQKWTRVPRDYQEIYQQALKEMQQPDFMATGTLLTAWGTSKGIPLSGRRVR